MLDVRLDKKTESRLERLCQETGHTKNYYAKKALLEFLDDREDYLCGIAVLKKCESTLTLAEMEEELDLDS